jgi:hypothetical protein
MRFRRAMPLTVLLLALGAPAAWAIPWDVGGAIPPQRTPPPVRPDPLCRESYANDPPRAGAPIRFGIGPLAAGVTGTTQRGRVVPTNVAARDAALRRLAGTRSFAVRLNRLFESDGEQGIDRYRRLARHFARLGLDVELQVRYHPRPAQNGDTGAWVRYVRRVVRAFGPLPRVTALQITNEANLASSPNTSDGAFRRAVPALVEGVVAAKDEARRRGFPRLSIGFNFAWRFGDGDARFWRALGRRGGARLRRAADWVGVDLYPGTFVPPAGAIVDLGDAFLEGIAQTHECYLPLAGFGRRTPLRIEETGWPTGPGRSDAAQRRALEAIVTTAVRYRRTYAITDLRWFGLRDNDSASPDLQAQFGLLRSSYRPKPAFAAYRRLIARFGAR